MSAPTNTNPARGMRDFLPIEVRKREYVIEIIKEVYESYGFEPLETPAVENLETLTGKYGEEGNQLIYKILKRGEKLEQSASEKDLSDLALRYDLTVPLARVVANHKNDLPRFFKRYQIQPVWRADRPARGRFREFYQCDVDAIGSSSMIVEAELCAAVSEILHKLKFKGFVIQLNHRKILSAMLNSVNVPKERHVEALITLDKFDKIGDEAVFNEAMKLNLSENFLKLAPFFRSILNKRREINQEFADRTMEHKRNVAFNKYNEDVLEIISSFIKGQEGEQGLSDIKKILEFVRINNLEGRVIISPMLARGLSYYTGAIMEINLDADSEFEDFNVSIGGGGRYDGLIGMFGKEEIPACGFSLGLERILVVMEERGMFPKELETNSADVLITVWNEESIGESLKLAGELRQQKLRVLVYPEADKLGKQFKYAAQINVPFVCILGESELAENKVTLKNMETGEQETIEREEAAARVKIHKQNSKSKS
ncbi:MAG: histidine--tRNA ligase [Acidobacteria bacterium]|jgi:histidyl-tRNA synthetase|nr:histidine--tRNA ligase [Acidobacteriota bacterium]